jgi:AAA family ATP:ADP antiporter
VGGGLLAGFRTIVTSPFVGGIAGWVFLLTVANAIGYFTQATIISEAGLSSDQRTQVFGFMDMSANILIPLLQFTLVRWSLQRLGVGWTLSGLALVSIVGFLALAAAPVLSVLIAFQIAYRAGSFAFSNPAREALWPVVEREDKYKAKNVVDNAVFRGGDVVNAWLYNALSAGAGLGLSAIALIGAPIAAGWFFLSLGLGRARDRREGETRAQDLTLKEATP